MAEVLELAHLRQRHRVAQMQIGSGWIYSEFHPQRPIFTQFLEQLLFADQLRPPLFNLFDDGLGVHVWRLAFGVWRSARFTSVDSSAFPRIQENSDG
jgi:hypothetical protein